MSNRIPPKPKSPAKVVKRIIIAIAVIALYVWTITSVNIDWGKIFSQRTIDNFDRIIPKFFDPAFGETGEILIKMVETIFIAYTGSLAAAIIAIPLAFLCATNMVRNKFLNTIGMWILGAVRAFPEIILAIIFVAAVGPNPFAGVLAIAIGSTGMLGKLYSEVIEGIDMHIIEAMEASGANKLQILFYGIMPQVLPEFLSYAIYRFEIDVRASSVLGIVGAGGIGTLIHFAYSNRNWDEVGMILLVIIVTVTIIDQISSFIRRRLV
ncbi:phosphonate ABC transporter, permease protein PhnE [Aquibacillus koreensis]|uniref:Phosphonate ABC transporter, permease protein PhnE n=1 Tax=Aquibacillus koreensis TaxID=279446 RepID=A0A9X3WLP4_9BACI|nr:phosphonate ABC transporter, permease protein PhnE [Aquibacillus koreensis]MCT2538153.1 phosphonate ABC transporter, permease protein PhnE [Aquibacillus koreensis]MDC3420903.1 phosphonate ABC transporter, permease protein PhnE [Aquibacillus koreensis]